MKLGFCRGYLIVIENIEVVYNSLILCCVMTITVLMLLFSPIIVAIGFRIYIYIYIPPQYAPKSQRNDFNYYSISLSKFHIKYVVKLVCEKRGRENVVKKRALLLWTFVMNNIWLVLFTYIQSTHLLGIGTLFPPSPLSWFIIISLHTHNYFFSYLTITFFHVQQSLLFIITNILTIPHLVCYQY